MIEEASRRGVLALFDIDVQGGETIKKKHPGAVRALILPPSLAELERRLRARSTDDDEKCAPIALGKTRVLGGRAGHSDAESTRIGRK